MKKITEKQKEKKDDTGNIISGWERITKEYTQRELNNAEKAAFERQKGIENAEKIMPFTLQ